MGLDEPCGNTRLFLSLLGQQTAHVVLRLTLSLRRENEDNYRSDRHLITIKLESGTWDVKHPAGGAHDLVGSFGCRISWSVPGWFSFSCASPALRITGSRCGWGSPELSTLTFPSACELCHCRVNLHPQSEGI